MELYTYIYIYMGVSKNRGGLPKSSILIGFSIINHPFWGTPILGNTHRTILLLIGGSGEPILLGKKTGQDTLKNRDS